MRIVAIETTDQAGTVAALNQQDVLREIQLAPHQRSAQSLAPALATLLRDVGWRPSDVQLVATVIGPGSFTGLRVGLTTARFLAYAADAAILGVDAFQTVLQRVPRDVSRVSAAVDAQRGDVVARPFQRHAVEGWQAEGPEQLVPLADWLGAIPHGCWLTGPALLRYHARVPAGLRVLDRELWTPTAGAAGQVAAREYEAGRRDNLFALAPRYSRRSGAEEKWELRHGGQPFGDPSVTP